MALQGFQGPNTRAREVNRTRFGYNHHLPIRHADNNTEEYDSRQCIELGACRVQPNARRTAIANEIARDDVLSTTFVDTLRSFNVQRVWHSSANLGTKLCWSESQNVWNIMTEGNDCSGPWEQRMGYVTNAFDGGDFVLSMPDTGNTKVGTLRCTSQVICANQTINASMCACEASHEEEGQVHCIPCGPGNFGLDVLADILFKYPPYLMASAESWNASRQELTDLSGNKRAGRLQSGTIHVGAGKGNGASIRVPYVSGTSSSVLQ